MSSNVSEGGTNKKGSLDKFMREEDVESYFKFMEHYERAFD